MGKSKAVFSSKLLQSAPVLFAALILLIGTISGGQALFAEQPAAAGAPGGVEPMAIGTPLIEVQAANLSLGLLSTWTNTGSTGGSFSASGSARPLVQLVGGRKAVAFDGLDDTMVSSFNSPFSGNMAYTVSAWVYNPGIADIETYVAWGKRGTEGADAEFIYGSNPAYGAVGHWGWKDMGFLGGAPTASLWHHLCVTFDGAIEKIYVDGVYNDGESKTLSVAKRMKMRIGAANGQTAPNYYPTNFFSGSVSSIRVYNTALVEADVKQLALAESDRLISLSVSSLPDGTLSTWTNSGTLQGSFSNDGTTPVVGSVADYKCVTFDGTDRMVSSFAATSACTGNSPWTVTAWLYNSSFSSEEGVLSWAPRGGANGSCAQANFGNSSTSGAIAHGGTTDMGFDGGQPADSLWHHVAVTFDGASEKVYVDGDLNAQESKTLNITNGLLFYLGCGYTYSAPNYTPQMYLSGSMGQLNLFNRALDAPEIYSLSLNNPSYLKVMPLGDSITDGYNVPGGYRIRLWSLIGGIDKHVNFVGSGSNGPDTLADKDHEGHPGWQCTDLINYINGWMDAAKPKEVLLHIGTNDIYYGATGQECANRLSTLIDMVCAKLPAGGKLYVAQIIPLCGSYANLNPTVIDYNSRIPPLVAQKVAEGKPVYCVDMYSAVTCSDLADGVHPNQTGYDKMADVWFAAIQNDFQW